MSREDLIHNCSIQTWETNEDKLVILINSALTFINWYTFQDYSLENIQDIPQDILYIIIDLVCLKMNQKAGVSSERLSDYSITYSPSDILTSHRSVLNKYRIIYVE